MNKIVARVIRTLGLAFGLTLSVVPGVSQANTAGPAWDTFPKDKLTDMASLQNGAKLFVNYCLNCHSASFVRFNKLHDIGLTDAQIKQNLLFTGEKVGDMMVSAINPREAKEWFGAAPPDLSLVARSRAGANGSGADYLYTYMRGFYRDATKATGWNNLVFPSVAMPHVLWELQGEQRPIYEEQKDPHDATKTVHLFKGFEQTKPGAMTKAEYDNAMADLVAFMQWMGEPAQGTRVRIGVFVMLLLALITFLAWRMNAAFWKDVK